MRFFLGETSPKSSVYVHWIARGRIDCFPTKIINGKQKVHSGISTTHPSHIFHQWVQWVMNVVLYTSLTIAGIVANVPICTLLFRFVLCQTCQNFTCQEQRQCCQSFHPLSCFLPYFIIILLCLVLDNVIHQGQSTYCRCSKG
jgi:hypothetical protein